MRVAWGVRVTKSFLYAKNFSSSHPQEQQGDISFRRRFKLDFSYPKLELNSGNDLLIESFKFFGFRKWKQICCCMSWRWTVFRTVLYNLIEVSKQLWLSCLIAFWKAQDVYFHVSKDEKNNSHLWILRNLIEKENCFMKLVLRLFLKKMKFWVLKVIVESNFTNEYFKYVVMIWRILKDMEIDI